MAGPVLRRIWRHVSSHSAEEVVGEDTPQPGPLDVVATYPPVFATNELDPQDVDDGFVLPQPAVDIDEPILLPPTQRIVESPGGSVADDTTSDGAAGSTCDFTSTASCLHSLASKVDAAAAPASSFRAVLSKSLVVHLVQWLTLSEMTDMIRAGRELQRCVGELCRKMLKLRRERVMRACVRLGPCGSRRGRAVPRHRLSGARHRPKDSRHRTAGGSGVGGPAAPPTKDYPGTQQNVEPVPRAEPDSRRVRADERPESRPTATPPRRRCVIAAERAARQGRTSDARVSRVPVSHSGTWTRGVRVGRS
mmetsp:Transcript_49276/g.130555  ORF Transcript_49276/g.130555 Transcript_49276/m.130555 type:complete len:307 (-) Transcript_49276:240-1160(-)